MAYYFNLPTDAELTEDQRAAINDINAIALSGGPGTGKSIVSIYRHINNYKLNLRKSILLTFTKSLKFYLANSVKSEANKAENNMDKQRILDAFINVDLANSWHGKRYEEIIIDEAQDLPENQIGSWPRGNITFVKSFANRISYGADDNQIIWPNKATYEKRLKEIFPNNNRHILEENFRNTYEILNFARNLFTKFTIPRSTLEMLDENDKHGPKPILKIVKNENEQNDAILKIINDFPEETHSIAILVPLINPAFHMQRVVSYFYNYIINKGLKCSYYENEMQQFKEIEKVHISSFKSAKGLEFDTVIIPDFQFFEKNIELFNVVQEEDYFVAMTRAKSNLFLISTEKANKINNDLIEIEDSKNNNINFAGEDDDLPF